MEISQKEKIFNVGFTVPFWKIASEINNKKRLDHTTSNYEGIEKNEMTVFGLNGISLFIALIISLIIFIWALVILIKYGNTMPTWALVLSIIFFFVPPGPLVSIILVYATKGKKKNV